ncbi:MAG TPA: ABC transporter substrate-binding protein [Rhizomicrobium sp.]|nr:ABC transporter substrate-binding protein [Rhizomicrobium sp.]
MKFALARIVTFAALAFVAATPLARAQAPDPAVATVQGFYDTLLESMKGGKSLGIQGRYNKLKPAIEQAFELTTMIKYAVGPAWDTASAADQRALSDSFEHMTVAQYAGNFDSYDGEKFVVDPKVDIRGTDHYVTSRLVTKDQTVVFIYRMRQFGSNWKIIDVLLDGSISQLSVYRSDYAATIKAGGAAALVKKIDAVADKAMKS